MLYFDQTLYIIVDMTYPLPTAIRDRIDHAPFGEEPHAFEEGTWTFLIGTADGLKRRLQVIGLYGSAAQRAVEAAEEDEKVVLING